MLWRWPWGRHLVVSVLSSGECQLLEGKLGAEREPHVETLRCHGVPGQILSPLPGAPLSTSGRQIFRLGSGETRRYKINLKEEHGEI
jgi:hypothetical protein